MKTLSENRAFGGMQGVYSHASSACRCNMTFGLFLPAEAERAPVPVLWYLSGLTCTHENAMFKAGRRNGRQRRAWRWFSRIPRPVAKVLRMIRPMIWGRGRGSM